MPALPGEHLTPRGAIRWRVVAMLAALAANGLAAPIAQRGLADAGGNAARPRLAVVPFAGATDASPLVDQLLAQVKPGVYELFDRARLSTMMVEQNVFPADLARDNAAAIHFGQDAGVRYLVIGALVREQATDLSAELLDCQAGQVVAHATAHFAKEEQAAGAMATLAADLKLRDDHPPTPQAKDDLLSAVNDAFKVTLQVLPAKAVYVEGDEISMMISANQDCYLTLVTRDSQGQQTYLLPNPWQLGQAHVKAGEPLSVPPKGAGFRFPIIPPHGQTLVKVVATRRELKLSEVDMARLKAEAEGTAEKNFVPAAHGARAIGVVGDEVPVKPAGAPLHELLGPRDWATAEVTFFTRPKE